MKTKRSHKLQYILLSVCFVYNLNFAQGPNAPEAASFEPVDATDMVNLATGSLSYVLPLMNVPSPEGGYPLTLAYHAGIGMEQEASWVGLGWNVNPGAINRSVNGYPDDYNGAQISEYYFDKGKQETIEYLISTYSVNSALSISIGLSWGSHKSLSGFIGIGSIIDLGNGYALSTMSNIGIGQSSSGGLNLMTPSGLSLGASFSNENFQASLGFMHNNGLGYQIGVGSNGAYSASLSFNQGNSSYSLGVGLSSNNASLSISASNSAGSIGKNFNFGLTNGTSLGDIVSNNISTETTVHHGGLDEDGNYNPDKGGTTTYGSIKSEYHLAKRKDNFIYGNQNFHKNSNFDKVFKVKCITQNSPIITKFDGIVVGEEELNEIFLKYMGASYDSTLLNSFQSNTNCNCIIEEEENFKPAMDVYEIPTEDHGVVKISTLASNNLIFPNYDKYNVQAQGLSGTISSKLQENGNLFNTPNLKSQGGYQQNFHINSVSESLEDHFKFNSGPTFSFENTITNYLDVNEASFHTGDFDNILDYYNTGVDDLAKDRKYSANYVESYTYRDIKQKFENNILLSEGFLFSDAKLLDNILFNPPKPNELDRSLERIAAFKITALDGKTYHYSLPVYNHEIITRTYGANGKDTNDEDAYHEKRQLEPYATHWLLTSITGPDFVDVNENGVPDSNDYGYWTRFDYGKWTDAYNWKLPKIKDAITKSENRFFKTRIKGRKELYYLNKVVTRTHTAVFVKEINENISEKSESWDYWSRDHKNYSNRSDISEYKHRFTIPSENKLKLKEIILFKNEEQPLVDKSTNGTHTEYDWPGVPESEKAIGGVFKLHDLGDIITEEDLPADYENKILKRINFNYKTVEDRTLLNSLSFLGNKGYSRMNPYKFEYEPIYCQDINNKQDEWGYNVCNPEQNSLSKIIDPIGAVTEIEYEENDFYEPVITKGREFHKGFKFNIQNAPSYGTYYKHYQAPVEEFTIIVSVDDEDEDLKDENIKMIDYFEEGNPFYIDLWLTALENYPSVGSRGYHRSTLDILPQYAEIDSIDEITNTMRIRVQASSPYRVNHFILDFKNFSVNRGIGGISTLGRYNSSWIKNPCGTQLLCNTNKASSLMFTIVGNKKSLKNTKGGGIRVKSLSLRNGNETYKTEYSYKDVFHQDRSSGTIPYIPTKENETVSFSGDLPAPLVSYEYVTMTANNGMKTIYHYNVMKGDIDLNSNLEEFYSVEKKQLDNFVNTSVDSGDKEITTSNYQINDNYASLGQLLSVKRYNSLDQMLGEKHYNYYKTSEIPNKIGVVKEAFQTYKKTDYEAPIHVNINSGNDDDNDDIFGTNGIWFVNSNSRLKFPSLLKSTTSISNGISLTTEFTDFNTISGQSQKTKSFDSYGNMIVVESTPAFKEYPGMGSKVDSIQYKNMLSQSNFSKISIWDKLSEEWKIINAEITTWNNDWKYFDYKGDIEDNVIVSGSNIWRKHKNYVWDGAVNGFTGVYEGFTGEDDNFDWGLGVPGTNSEWVETSETTMYDHFSASLEAKDINGNRASTKMGDRHSKIIATSNAAYTEMYYSGAEYIAKDSDGNETDYYDGGVKANEQTNLEAHTGVVSEKVDIDEHGFEVNLPENLERTDTNAKFKISVWVKKTNHSNARIHINGETKEFNGDEVFAGDWVLKNHYEELSSGKETVYITSDNGIVYADDFRLHPIAASMTSYVYNEWNELSYIIGANGLATHYTYDSQGRLKETFSEIIDVPANEKYPEGILGGFKPVTSNNYNYKK